MSAIIITGILLALIFDFLNGMNDAANSIATVVSTRVLSPRMAVLWAAFFNFAGAFGFGAHVATTIGKGIVHPDIVTPGLVLSALIAAIVWTYLCTYMGLPISVSHALIGGLAGAGIIKAGTNALIAKGIIKVAAFIFIAPLLGMVLGSLLTIVLFWMVRNWPKNKTESVSSRMQLFSAALYSLGHGLNDAQKTMGIISVLLFSAVMSGEFIPSWMYHGTEFYVPKWVIVTCYTAIAFGTMAGGWRVIQTVGMKITKLRPLGGFAAETGGGLTIIMASYLGIPVSTTHTITGSVTGVGLVTNIRAVRWGIARRIFWAWILTLPMSGLAGALIYEISREWT